ncbi:MAG: ComEA family DNA-binding protein [Longimicrobiales bacterium]|jgi:competence ComEA-like helix-hairpin-helix protein
MDSETRALRRTALFLLTVSVFRWVAARPTIEPLVSEPARIDQLIDSSRASLGEQQARSRGFEEGEWLDPNLASEIELDRLPGVGAGTAAEIVAERERDGPFLSVEDLVRVSGVGQGTLAKVRPFMRLADRGGGRLRNSRSMRLPVSSVVQKIDLNRADSAALTGLPGIGPALASRILAERRKHRFRSVEALVRVRGVGPSTVSRLKGLVRVGRSP